MAYIPYPVQVDTDAIVAAMVADLAARTGVTPNEGDPLLALAEAFALRMSETRIVQADIAAEIFRGFGRNLVPPIDAAAATAQATWTASAATVIPAGARFSLTDTDGVRYAFFNRFDLPVAAATPTGGPAEALVQGAGANGLSGTATKIDGLPLVTAISVGTATAGGVERESPIAYADRLFTRLRRLSDVPRKTEEFADAATEVVGVYRARAIKGYNAATATAGVNGHVTVAVVSQDGTDVSAATLAEVDDLLNADDRRPLKVTVHVVHPTRQAVSVNYVGKAKPGYVPATVEAAADAALLAFLNPATFAGGGELPPTWTDLAVIRHQDLSTVLNTVDGFDYWTTLTIGGATADVTLTGVAVLPTPTITSTVT